MHGLRARPKRPGKTTVRSYVAPVVRARAVAEAPSAGVMGGACRLKMFSWHRWRLDLSSPSRLLVGFTRKQHVLKVLWKAVHVQSHIN